MPRWLIVITFFVYLSAILAAALVRPIEPAPTAGAGPNPESRIPNPPPLPLPLIGFTLNLHHNDDHPLYQQTVTDLADMGFNAIQFTVPVFQTDGQSSDIRIEVGPQRGPRSDRLIDLIHRARARGMVVILTPIVLLTNPRGDEWRGRISPQNWNAWWASYQRMSDFFLDIAAQNDVQIYAVGSELLTTESQSHRWQRIIARARSRFGGQLTYASHWDHYDAPTFWQQLDFVGVNEYFDVTDGHSQRADGAALATAWSRRRDRLLTYAAGFGKPLLFTELGYPSLPWALEKPWKYTHDGEQADHDAQAAGYRAFLSAWRPLLLKREESPSLPAAASAARDAANFAGVIFYEWDPYRRGDPDDTHYGIRGKPAEALLRELMNKKR